MRLLIVYFSRTGHTRDLAMALARDLHGAGPVDIEEITEPRSRSGIWGYLRSAMEALRHRHVPIDPIKHAPDEYDMVLIGSPNWASNLSAPMQSWLAQAGADVPAYAAFVTQGGSGGEKVLAQLVARVGHAPAATIIVNNGEMASGAYRPAAQAFVAELGVVPQGLDG